MEGAAPIDADLVDLVVQLSTRIGMIMEDVSPLAINASQDGLKGRVAEVVSAVRTIMLLADAAEALLRG